ncbi:MAG TPA: methionine--tRNA ligase [Candidatus Thermoplasmatota archaeon]|nr:methionine--tRNA ligase [Candidatus Thermoplasmatota archaeon]
MQPRHLVAVAWPYANGPLHLGHVAGSLLPPDVFARFLRLTGRDAIMVSGSDMHGTPITVAADKTGKAPEALAAEFHRLHVDALRALGIHFDIFTSTATDNHRRVAQDVFVTLLKAGYIEKRSMTAPYDPKAGKFLPDRYVEGTCPHCGFADARGDQCDECGRTLDAQELKAPRSKLTGSTPEWRETEHFFLLLSKLEPDLKEWVSRRAKEAGWRPTVVNFTENWLREGLKDRPITRDMLYGVPIPKEAGSYPDKRIYVWFEAVCGYYSAPQGLFPAGGWERYWLAEGGPRAYYFLGKDNIPFHTIVWPAMIIAYNKGQPPERRLALPWDVPANEFLQFKGAKFSKSRGNAFYVLDLLRTFTPDEVRYYLTVNMPEKGDTDWTWEDFTAKVNDELVATLGNYVNRVLAYADRTWGGIPADAGLDPAARAELVSQFVQPFEARLAEARGFLEGCEFKKGLRALVAAAAVGNKSVDTLAPWAKVKQGEAGKARAGAELRFHVAAIAALSRALAPFLPHAADRLHAQLGEAAPGPAPGQASTAVHAGRDLWPARLPDLPASGRLGKVEPLFRKLDPKEVAAMFETSDTKDTPATSVPKGTDATKATDASKAADSASVSPPAPGSKPTVTIDDFGRLDLRVGVVVSVEDHPKADKLYVLKVDLGGETRQVVAGLRGLVAREELLGRRVVMVANLAPARLRGVESQGMLLAAEDASGRVTPLTVLKDLPPGSRVR